MRAQDDWNPSNPPEPAVKYKVTTSSSPNYGYTSGGGSFTKGQQTWISTSAYGTGYKFLYWTMDGEKYTESQSFSYTVEEKDVAFVAYYEYNPDSPSEPDGVLSYKLYLNSNLSGCCSFNRTSGGKIKVGENVNLQVYYNQGYKFLGWYSADTLFSESNPVNFQMLAKDMTLTAMVEYNPDNPGDPPSDKPAPIKVSVKDCTRMYGDSNPSFEYVKSSDFPGEPVVTCEADANSPVGTYTIKIERGTIEGENLVLENGTLTVTKAPLTIKAGEYSKKQGEENPTFTPTYEGFRNSDTAESLTTKPTVSCDATKVSPVGEYAVIVSGAVATNYEISYVNGKLTIEVMTFVAGGDDNKDEDDPATYLVTSFDETNPTVSITGSTEVKGAFEIPETVEYGGVTFTVTEIAPSAFENKTEITDIIIPITISKIGANAFKGCSNLKSITVNNSEPIDLSNVAARSMATRTDDSSIFEGVDKETCVLYVPEGSVDLYKAAPVWKEFVNIMAITSSGIYGVVSAGSAPYDIFDFNGRKVKSKVIELEGLPKGIFIVRGKKIIIKR